MSDSVHMPTNVVDKPFTKMIAVSKSMFSGVIGTSPSAMIAKELNRFVLMYHPRPFQSVSTTGAQRNFHVCGSRFIATNAAMTLSFIPAFAAKWLMVTPTNPEVAPNGRNKMK